MNDQKTVRLVIGILGLVGCVVVVGGIVLAMSDRGIPDALIAIGAGAISAVGSILARTSGDGPQPVVVENVAADPVPVAETPKPAGRVRKQAGQVTPGVLALVLVVALIVYLFVR